MKRKRWKRTPEQRAADEARAEAQIRTLKELADKIRAELATKSGETSA
jgi:hypothetical protein